MQNHNEIIILNYFLLEDISCKQIHIIQGDSKFVIRSEYDSIECPFVYLWPALSLLFRELLNYNIRLPNLMQLFVWSYLLSCHLDQIGDSYKDPVTNTTRLKKWQSSLNTYYACNCRILFTGRGYSPHAPGSSGTSFCPCKAAERFITDTKVISDQPHSYSADDVEQSINGSLAR